MNRSLQYSPAQSQDKSLVSPVISQLMRKDKEISTLREDVSQSQINNKRNLIRIKLLEQEIFSRDQYIVELQNSVQNSVQQRQQTWDVSQQDQDQNEQLSISNQVQANQSKMIEELQTQNSDLLLMSEKFRKLKLKSKKFKQSERELKQLKQEMNQIHYQNDQYQSLLSQYNIAQEQIKNLKKRLQLYDQKRNEEIINVNESLHQSQQLEGPSIKHTRSRSIQAPNLLKAQVQSIQNIESRPILNAQLLELKFTNDIEKVEQQLNFTVEALQQLLTESLEREQECGQLLDQLVTKCSNQNLRLLNQNLKLEETLKINYEQLEAQLLLTHEKMLFYKEKCEVMGELFDHLRKFDEDKSTLKGFIIYLKQFQDQLLQGELPSLFNVISLVEQNNSPLNQCVIKQQDLINRVQLQQDEFIQLIQQKKTTHYKKPQQNSLYEGLTELLQLCITSDSSSDDVIERVRKIVQQNNRHDLERKKWDQENFQLKQQISSLFLQLKSKEDSLRQQHYQQEYDQQRQNQYATKEHQEFSQTTNNQLQMIENLQKQVQELNHQDRNKTKEIIKGQENINTQNKIITHYKEKIEEHQYDNSFIQKQKELFQIQQQEQQQKDIYDRQQKFNSETNETIKRIQKENQIEINKVESLYESKLESQEQYYLGLFNNMQYSIKQKQKQIEQKSLLANDQSMCLNKSRLPIEEQTKTKSKSFLSYNSENQSNLMNQTQPTFNEINQVAEYYKKKCMNNFRRKVKDFETVLEYIYELSKGYDPENKCYITNTQIANSEINKIHSKVNIIFDQNPELKYFVKKIEEQIQQSFGCINIKQQNKTIKSQFTPASVSKLEYKSKKYDLDSYNSQLI